jgi:prepilin-type N-terminal cleavage/methylation domain-containing protein
MNSGHQPHGFTIIEVLIVLGLASFLFFAAVLAMSGDQSQTEFDTGARQIYSELQSLSTDVQNGLYTNSSVACTYNFADNVPGYPIFSTGSGNKQGENLGCVYVGKAIQFNPSSNSPNYYVYSLVGDQFSNSELAPPAAFPSSSTVLDTSRTQPFNFPPTGTQTVTLPDSFTISKITYADNPLNINNDIIGFYNVGTTFLSSPSSLGDQLFVIPLQNSTGSAAINYLNADKTQAGTIGDYDVNPNSTVTVCFASPLESREFVNIAFENQADSANLVLSYSYGSC